MKYEQRKPRILVTSGEPAGIGPDLIITLAQINHQYDLTVIGDPDLLLERAKCISLPLNITSVSNPEAPQYNHTPNSIKAIPVNLNTACIPGQLDARNASYVLETLDIASRECLSRKYDAIVTAPIQKSIINDAGISFSGHTEYFAKRCGVALPVMLLACPELRVALVTTHLALRDVPEAITRERVTKTVHIVIHELQQRFGINNPRITVCGLNPHAGEGGHLGKEETTIIKPVLDEYTKQGHKITGPLPADTAFRTDIRNNTDVFICMYHDQGLPVLKTLGFGEAVNITLGLPIIRTSVDHGTALEIAGTGKAESNSLFAAINMANELAQHQIEAENLYSSSETINEH